jgi:Tol biopolymer transport system component
MKPSSPFPICGRRLHTAVSAAGCLSGAAVLVLTVLSAAGGNAENTAARPALLAYSSDRGQSFGVNNLYLFDLRAGRYLDLPGVNTAGNENHAALDGAGRLLAYTRTVETEPGRTVTNIHVLDRETGRHLDLPGLNSELNDLHPTLSADGRRLAFFTGGDRFAGSDTVMDVVLYDLQERKQVPLPGLNSPTTDSYPALSPEGRYLAFQTIREKRTMRSDVYLYDLQESRLVETPLLNTANNEEFPSVGPDGRLIALASNRGFGKGGYDIYLYDRQKEDYIPLPGLNTTHDEIQPTLCGEGRWIVFVSNRPGGTGRRDLYRYDVRSGKTEHLAACNSSGMESLPSLSRYPGMPEGPVTLASENSR